jgi:hypothetical protein
MPWLLLFFLVIPALVALAAGLVVDRDDVV